MWNSLPLKVVEAKALCDFEKRFDIALGAKGIEGYRGNQDIEFDDQPCLRVQSLA